MTGLTSATRAARQSATRRSVLSAGLMGTVLCSLPAWTPSTARAAAIPDASEIPFRVYKDQRSEIGFHRLRFDRQGDETLVDVEIELDIRIGFIPVFRYRHTNREVWRGEVLQSLQSTTDDNGDDYRVRVDRTGGGYLIRRNGDQERAEGPILPTSYWRAETVSATRLLDTQRGVFREVATTPVAEETVSVDGRPVAATRYRMAGALDLDLWYSQAGQWVKLAFSARGVDISYALDGAVAANPARPIAAFVADLG